MRKLRRFNRSPASSKRGRYITCASKPKFEVCIHESYITLIKMDPNSDLKLDIYFLRLSKACLLKLLGICHIYLKKQNNVKKESPK